MGQNVNYLLGGQQNLLGADPEVYRQQLIQQEQARIGALAPNLQLGAQLGTLLGRGISNVAQGRGFLEVTNPVLQKLTQIQDVYNTSMKEADPNDPLSFYSTLQKNFSAAGLGQQALMASVEAKKFEDMNLKSEQLKTQVFKENPALLDTQIAKARSEGNDKLANQLAEQRGQIQVKLDRDAQKELLAMAVQQSNIDVNRAQIAKLGRDVDNGKVQITQTPASLGAPAYVSVFRDGVLEKSYPIGGDATTAVGGTAPSTPAKGERKPLGQVLGTQPAPAPAAPQAQPVAAPVVPGQAANTNAPNPLAPNGEYRAAYDPVFLGIQQAITQDPARLASDPEFMAAITKARNDRVEQLRKQYGNMVNFTGVL